MHTMAKIVKWSFCLGILLAAGSASATTYYVGPSGSDENPGTEAEPFASIAAALAKDDVTEVRVAAGDYATMAGMAEAVTGMTDGNFLGILRSPVKIVGAGADVVTLHCSKGSAARACGFWLNDAGAEVSGVTVVGSTSWNVTYGTFGTAFQIVAGTVKDCVVRDCGSQAVSSQVRLDGAGAVMQDCKIVNNVGPTNCKCCPGVTIADGLLLRCLISDNQGGDATRANGLDMTGGEARDCIIRNCNGANNTACLAGGVYLNGGFLNGCTVTNNNNGSRYMSADTTAGAGGVYIGNNVAACVSNCLIAGNHDYVLRGRNVAGLVVDSSKAKVYDTVIEDNRAANGPQVYMKTECLVSNCTIRDSDGNELVRRDAGTMTEDCVLDDGTASETRPAETFVSLTGSDTAPYDEPAKATRSLQRAIDAVRVGGTVHVAAGDYKDNLDLRAATRDYSRNVFITKKVRVQGPDDPSTAVFTYKNNSTLGSGIQMGCADAFLCGITLTGYHKLRDGEAYKYAGAVLHVNAGMVSNVVVTGCTVDTHTTQPVGMVGGVVTHTVIRDNYYQGSSCGRGSMGLLVAGGEFRHGIVRNNGIKDNLGDQALANGVLLWGGTISDTIIENNYGGGASKFGAGVNMTGGTLERCIIQNNAANPSASRTSAAGGVYASGGTIRNCLIGHNSTPLGSSAGGLFTEKAAVVVQHCTFVGNTASAGTDGAVLANGSSMKACVSTDKISCTTGTADVYTEGLNFYDPAVTFPLDWETVKGYSITAASAGYNAVRENLVTDDLLGVVRPVVGEDENDFPDAGAMEKVKSAGILALVDPASATLAKGDSVTFRVSVDGDDTTVKACHWKVTFGGVTSEYDTTTDTFTLTATEAGAYALSVQVTNGSDVTSPEKEVSVVSKPFVCFVAKDGASIAPYDEPEKAATNLCDAIDAVFGAAGRPGLVRVAAGDYSDLATALAGDGFSYVAVLDKPVQVVADEGPERTSIAFDSAEDIGGGFILNDDDALLSGFTVSGRVNTTGKSEVWTQSGIGVTMTKGVVSNCVFRQCRTTVFTLPAVLVAGGTVTGCTIGPNSAAWGQFGRGAIGLYVGGGTVTNCVITENSIASDCNNPDLLYASGLYLAGSGVVTDSIICSNRFVSSKQFQANQPVHAAGAVLMGGTLENCHVFANDYSETNADNTYESAGVAVNDSAAVVCNCLIEGNRCGNTHAESGAGLTIRAGLVDHVTITGNGPLDDVGTVGGLGVSGGTVKNTIVWGNVAGDASVAGGTVTHSCAPELTTGTGNLAVDPKFRRKGYAIGMHSPCAYAGEGGTYMGYAAPVPDGLTILVR